MLAKKKTENRKPYKQGQKGRLLNLIAEHDLSCMDFFHVYVPATAAWRH